jgi:hypothetical protein
MSQFSGVASYCDEHARKDPDFRQEGEFDTFYWKQRDPVEVSKVQAKSSLPREERIKLFWDEHPRLTGTVDQMIDDDLDVLLRIVQEERNKRGLDS